MTHRHIALDCSHLEKREQLLKEETSRRAVDFIAKKDQLVNELTDIEVHLLALLYAIVILCLF